MAAAVIGVSGRIPWYCEPQPGPRRCAVGRLGARHGIVGRLMAVLSGAVYGDAVSMVAMLMVVMGVAVVLAWRPTTRL